MKFKLKKQPGVKPAYTGQVSYRVVERPEPQNTVPKCKGVSKKCEFFYDCQSCSGWCFSDKAVGYCQARLIRKIGQLSAENEKLKELLKKST